MTASTGDGGPARLQVGRADGARTHHRDAVRAIAVDDAGRYLLLAEELSPGVKFPGGGVADGESDDAALAREVREETGYELARIDRLAVVVDERRPGLEPDVVLAMQSRYYRVTLGRLGSTALEDDEIDLGLEPVLLPLEEALRRQRGHVGDHPQPWAHRELAVLEWLAGLDGAR